ncbi:hypothetical protein [Micrococcus yunnanensis]|uniref:Helix-turn-helix domain-containing protein n=1 Tax=Micrococcus yunnanensis TaxID=566027 RepID=A0ABR6D0E1_9MICC|nr:hypothetical protein [Micrococcus yunnanensis]MBA9059526.1 hypothetical protein [Micrococcus yunnanensis]TFE79359.1 hypothetical protein E2F93_11060 [Micrococcus yunnanensis]
MGASNVIAAYTYWRDRLSHRDLHALVFMAVTALDSDRPPVYYGGWEAVARALGLDLEGNPASAKRTTVKALTALTEAGAITSSGTARAGIRAEYALNLAPGTTYVPSGRGRNVTWTARPTTARGTAMDPQVGTVVDPQRGTVVDPLQGDRGGPRRGTAVDPPRRTQEPQGGTREEPPEEPPITSQPNPGTRVRESDAVNDDRTPSKAEQEARLLAWAAEHYTEDPDALTA